MGPIPGVEVGSSWKYRVGVSTGISSALEIAARVTQNVFEQSTTQHNGVETFALRKSKTKRVTFGTRVANADVASPVSATFAGSSKSCSENCLF